jgi:hypothetical protein
VTVGGGLEFGERDAAAGLEEPQVVVPVHLFKGGDLGLLSGPPRSAESPDLDSQRLEVDSANVRPDRRVFALVVSGVTSSGR